MANRTFNQFQGTLQKGVVTLYAKLTVASGIITVETSEVINASTSPVTINPSNGLVGEAVSPVLISSVDTYTFKLQDPYVRLLSVRSTVVTPNGQYFVLEPIVFADNVNNNTIPSLTLAFLCADLAPGGAVPSIEQPADGTILLALDLANSTAL
jgi:hypothetical protein